MDVCQNSTILNRFSMKKSIRTLVLAALCSSLANLAVVAQTTSYRDPQTIIDEGVALHDKGQYQQASEIFATVPQSSHLYPLACYESALSLYYLNNYAASLNKIEEALWLGYDQPEALVLKANVLDDTGHTPQAVSILEELTKKYPYNQNVLYNLGICYLNQQMPVQAENVLLQSVRIQPFHSRSHNALAKANYMMGRTAQSYLAANMGILLVPRIASVAELENYIAGRADSLMNPAAYPYADAKEAARWSRLKHLMQYEAGYSQNAPYTYKPDYMVARHSLHLFKSAQFNPSDTSVYNQLYAKTLSAIYKQGWFDVFVNHMFSNANNEEVNQWLKQNEKRRDAFFEFIRDELNTAKAHGFSASNAAKGIVIQNYDDDDKLYAVGASKKGVEDSEYGPWMYVNRNGSITQMLTFKNGAVDGQIKRLYPNGSSEQQTFKENGNFQGTQKTYYPDGAPQGVYNFKDGARHGKEIQYTSSGLIAATYDYADGKTNGESTVNHYDEAYSRLANYTNDLQNGPLVETWANGQLKLKATLADNYYHGPYESFYSNGQLESKGDYLNGFYHGPWRFYHFNGKLRFEVAYADSGKYQGVAQWYDLDGRMESKEESYDKGILNGTHTDYFDNGQPSAVLTYKADKPTSGISYSAKGDVMYETSLVADEDSVLYMKYFYENGALKSEGAYVHGKMSGLWKNYNPHGVLTREATYHDHMQHGPQTNYHPNGKIQSSYQCDSNRIVGAYHIYTPFGQLAESHQYNTKGLHGVSYEYYPSGSVKRTADFVDGTPAGRTIYFAPDGQKTLEVYYTDGRETRSVYYDEKERIIGDFDYSYGTKNVEIKFANGQLKKRFTVVDNLYHQTMETWYPNGKLKSTVNFHYGKSNGTESYYTHKGELASTHQLLYGQRNGQSVWYRNGKTDFTNPYINGVDHGVSSDFYENGKVFRLIEYRNDVQHGFTDFFAEDGTPMYRLRYHSGSITGVASPLANGQWGSETDVDANTTNISARYANGKISMTAQLKNGQYNGKTLEYSPMETLVRETEYENDSPIGTKKLYYANGKPKQTIHYQQGLQHGSYVRYYDNGLKELEGAYDMGRETGTWKYYDRNGKLTQTIVFHDGEAIEIK